MQRLAFFLAAGGEESRLYAQVNTQPAGSFHSSLPSLRKAVRRHFKATTGFRSGVTVASSNVRYPTVDWARKSLLRANNSLCPGGICGLEGERKVYFRGKMDRPLIALVGEAPGGQEAATGIPFIGPSGKILTSLLHHAGYHGDYIITNTVLCRPEKNRDPLPQEKKLCLPRLLAFLQRTGPKAVVMVGAHAASTFFKVANPQKGESNIPTNCFRTVAHGGMTFLHIRHPSYWLHRGGPEHKKNKGEVEDTIFTLNLLREMLTEAPKKARGQWDWLSLIPVLYKRELSLMDQALKV